jgi:ribosomal silencing factor RsfS
VEKVLRDVRAGDVRVFPVGEGGLHGGACADYMVVATGRSDWHVRNIAQALLYKARTPLNFPFLCLPREERDEGFLFFPGASQPAIFLVVILP